MLSHENFASTIKNTLICHFQKAWNLILLKEITNWTASVWPNNRPTEQKYIVKCFLFWKLNQMRQWLLLHGIVACISVSACVNRSL